MVIGFVIIEHNIITTCCVVFSRLTSMVFKPACVLAPAPKTNASMNFISLGPLPVPYIITDDNRVRPIIQKSRHHEIISISASTTSIPVGNRAPTMRSDEVEVGLFGEDRRLERHDLAPDKFFEHVHIRQF